jgi:RimJ/RimL family protein N-acetyltransferase
MDPLTLEIPEQIESERLLLVAPRPEYAEALSRAIDQSLPRLLPWMPWALNEPLPPDERQRFLRERYADYYLRRDLMLLILRREDEALVGATGLHRIDWSIPKMEIGYWIRSGFEGRGYVTEAVSRLTDFALQLLHAQRVEIRCDRLNQRSVAVARRLA